MKKLAIALLVLVLVCVLGLALVSRTKPGLAGTVKTDDPQLVARGQYVARLADCAACHTAINGNLYAGGLRIDSPVGAIYSTNITPDKQHGIGGYSLADFDRAVRQGVRKDGASLYPAMPYPSFARMSDEDIKALYAYFMAGVPASPEADKAEDIRWPLSMRWPLAVWRGMFAPPVGMTSHVAADDAQLRRGEYLVTGPGHCGACHSPRGKAMQEKGLDGSSHDFLAGGTVIDHWYVPSLRGEDMTGLGRWDEDQIVEFLKTGRTDHSAAFGGMSDVVAWSSRYYTDEDLHAVARYLKTLPAAPGQDAAYVRDDATTRLLDGGQLQSHPGALVYQQECAICHRNDGGGVSRMFPPLAGNSVVMSKDPISVVHLIASGAALPASNWAPSNVSMPAYADRLSDQQIADVTNFIRSGWGNTGSTDSTAASVAAIRARLPESNVGGEAVGWQVMTPQPYGEGWTFSPQTHTGHDAAQ